MEIINIPKKVDNEPTKLKVAAYARVSQDKDAAFCSFKAQKDYYTKRILSNPDWELVGIYADNAISGTTINRPEFMRLLRDCRVISDNGDRKIDLIITKSVSRFARNVVTLLSTIRELKALGVDIYFEEENMHSISPDGELMITFIAMNAEEEARSVSENIRWRIRKRFEKGEPWVGKMLGYRLKNRKLVIVEEEAEIVRKIFALYLSGNGYQYIAKYLQKHYPLTANISVWSKNGVHGILTNEKYKGDMLLQKTYRPDFRSGKDIEVKESEVQQYYVTDSHEPIIPPAVFDNVQNEMIRRKQRNAEIINNSKEKNRRKEESDENTTCNQTIGNTHLLPTTINPNKNLFNGLIFCNRCEHGCIYRCKCSGKYKREIMICYHHDLYGNSKCTNKSIPMSVLINHTCQLLRVTPGQLTPVLLRKRISQIRLDSKILIYTLTDGRTITKKWELISRRKSWTPEMREKARQKAIEYYKAKRAAI